MTAHTDFPISITPAWNDWRSANARLGALTDVHWHQPDGAPHVLIHAYVSCADLVNGGVPHRCDAASAPHRLRVCVLKRHNMSAAYAELERRAASRQRMDA
jgi:hypothetical protein